MANQTPIPIGVPPGLAISGDLLLSFGAAPALPVSLIPGGFGRAKAKKAAAV